MSANYRWERFKLQKVIEYDSNRECSGIQAANIYLCLQSMAGKIQSIVVLNSEHILSICILIVFQFWRWETAAIRFQSAQFLKISTKAATEGQFQNC